MIQGKLPPQGSHYAYRWIVPKEGSPTLDHYVFLDDNQKELGSSEQPTNYDPRPRFWYRGAERAGTIMISDPDVFAAVGLIGVTVAAPFSVDGNLLGRCGGRHHAGRPWRLSRRAQDQPGHAELHPRSPGQGDRGLGSFARPTNAMTGKRRAASHHVARQPAAGHRLRRASPRQRGHVLLYPRRQGVCRQPVDPAGRIRQEVAAFHHHAAGRFHRRVPVATTNAC